MSNIEEFEVLLVCIIVGIQLFVFAKTFLKIKNYKKIIPDVDSLKIAKLNISLDNLKELTPSEILQQKDNFINTENIDGNEFIGHDDDNEPQNSPGFFESISEEKTDIETIEVNIIQDINSNENKVFRKILFAINNYLIRNRGASSDFNLIKDIVERNSNAEEEDINLTISIPLYLGLMGTMIGIVIALFNMPSIGMDIGVTDVGENIDEGIAILIGGVKIAMIASFVGLGLTIINSGWVFKGSRSFNEAKKNDFYTFVQIELLPIINQGLASTLDSLQRNLIRFNEEFSGNLKNLTGVFNSNKEAMQIQKDLIESLDKTKVAEMTKYNVQVLQELNTAVDKFAKFNAYMGNITQFVENTHLIVGRTNELLARTDNFKVIADNIEDKFSQSQQLIDFLNEHFRKLEEHKEFTQNAVTDVGASISDIFKELREHIENSSEAIKKFTVDETDALKSALSESRTNLSNLEYLSNLKSDVSQFKDSSASQGERIKQALESLNQNMAKSIALLEQLEKKKTTVKVAMPSIKNLFKSKK